MRIIYLDYNATTPISPLVQAAMRPFLETHYGNPSSGHVLGRACREAIEDARGKLGLLLDADADEIVFTCGGTESNNLALKGVMLAGNPLGGGHLVITSLEHPAVVEPARFLQRLGCSVTTVPCDRDGVVDPDQIRQALRPNTRLVSIMHANNEIGTIQPIAEIARICRQNNVLLHTDAAQSVGKIRVSVRELGVDLLTVAGHKMYAPKGVGALYIRRGLALEPALHGAGQEAGVRPGTENTPYIVGLGRAADLALRGLDEMSQRTQALRDSLLAQLQEGLPETLRVNGQQAERLPNTLSVNFPGVDANQMLSRATDLCASTGSACHSGASRISPTLEAIGLPPDIARGTLRLSVGWNTSQEDIDRAASLLLDAWEALRETAQE